jgi:copper(I)-binding protein
MTSRKLWIGLLAVAALALAGCSSNTGIVVEEAWVRPSSMEAGNGAAFMVIRNTGREADALISAETDICETVELHQTTMEGDMASMHPVERIDVPAGGTVSLEPGGYHVMLIGVTDELVAGETVSLTLNFEKAGAIAIQAEVREQ